MLKGASLWQQQQWAVWAALALTWRWCSLRTDLGAPAGGATSTGHLRAWKSSLLVAAQGMLLEQVAVVLNSSQRMVCCAPMMCWQALSAATVGEAAPPLLLLLKLAAP